MFKRGSSPFAFVATLLLIAATLAEHSSTLTSALPQKDVESDKRGSNAYEHDDLEKYQELREPSNLHIPDYYIERLLSEELEKRASMRGFQGMRGKKSELDGNEPLASYYYNDYYEKRAPMGFQGMRGKKAWSNINNELDDEYGKRAPMGFQGMRGKKNYEEIQDDPEKRRFYGTRGKKSVDFDLNEMQQEQQLFSSDPEQERSEWYKRAPMDFQGMRGRKNYYLENLKLRLPEKRAVFGFHGMRGKKYYEREYPLDSDGYVEKRPMMMGFHGMRGKRSTNNYEVQH